MTAAMQTEISELQCGIKAVSSQLLQPLLGDGQQTDNDARKFVSWTIETERLIRAGVIMCNLFVAPRYGVTTS